MEPVYVDFAFVKQHADLRAVLARYGVALPQQHAKNIKIRCLFHREEHASLSISLERKVFHCFGCGEGGDLIALVARKEGATLREAARLIATLSGTPCAPPEATRTARPRSRSKAAPSAPERPQDSAAAASAAQTLPTAQTDAPEPPTPPQTPVNMPLTLRLKLDPSHPYLAARGLTPQTIATFGLGYAARGLLKGRIAIPIHNEAGELIAYAGRWPEHEGWPSGEEKYKLPKGFEKRHVLFNLHRLLAEAGRVPDGELVVVEGYFGVFGLFQAGIPAVALMGRSIAAEQIALLRRVGVSRVRLLLDGDTPGRQSAESLVILLAKSFFVRDVVLPPGCQPDALDEAALRSLLC